MNEYAIYQAQLGATAIRGCSEQGYSMNPSRVTLFDDGQVSPVFQGIGEARPEFTFTTNQLGAAVTAIGSGLSFTSGSPAVFYAMKKSETGRSTSSDHEKLSIAKGVVFPVSINASSNQVATMQHRVAIAWDGTNEPIVPSAASLNSIGTVEEPYTVGPLSIGGTTIDQLQSLSLSYNISHKPIFGDGVSYPYDICLETVAPVLTATTTKASILRTPIGWKGSAAVAIVAYWRRMKTDGHRYTTAETKHLKLTGTALVTVDSLAGDPQTVSLTCSFVKVGSNALYTHSVDAAIA